MTLAVLYDTSVLVDFLRGRGEARAEIEAESRTCGVSALVAAELYAGVRLGQEETALASLLSLFEPVPLDADDARLGGEWRRVYGPSHGTGLVDALLAAQAARLGAELVTLNGKHFPMPLALRVPYRRA